jgi:hypothetical protein
MEEKGRWIDNVQALGKTRNVPARVHLRALQNTARERGDANSMSCPGLQIVLNLSGKKAKKCERRIVFAFTYP